MKYESVYIISHTQVDQDTRISERDSDVNTADARWSSVYPFTSPTSVPPSFHFLYRFFYFPSLKLFLHAAWLLSVLDTESHSGAQAGLELMVIPGLSYQGPGLLPACNSGFFFSFSVYFLLSGFYLAFFGFVLDKTDQGNKSELLLFCLPFQTHLYSINLNSERWLVCRCVIFYF